MTTSNTTLLSQANLKSQVIEQLENKLFCDLVMDYNDMADAYNYEMIYNNDEQTLNDYFTNPYDAIRQTNHEGYNDNDDYFIVNGYGHLNSFSYSLDASGCPIDTSELAQWIIDNDSYDEYDIEVMTINDILASIEDNITDDENMLNEAVLLISPPLKHRKITLSCNRDSYIEYKVEKVMNFISDYNEKQLTILINRLGINM